jgi:hypothetical protein
MMRLPRFLRSAAAAAVLAGCASGNGEAPLVFGTTNVYGVSIGGNVAETGAEFLVGYKGFDLAIIPVSVGAPGGEHFIGAKSPEGHRDSYSVIGQFSAEAGSRAGGANAGLGKFFATGVAAQNIAFGFAKKMGAGGRTSVEECGKAVPQNEVKQALAKLEQKLDQHIAGAAPTAKDAAVKKAPLQQPEVKKAAAPAAQAGADRPGARLIFAQYEYLALAIDGSALESGIKLTLGLRDRNVAVIPLVGRDANGNLVPLDSKNPDSGDDALSVLGQFKSNNKIGAEAPPADGATKTALGDGSQAAPTGREISSGLEKFFSTGAAADTLAGGFKVKLCEEYTPPQSKDKTQKVEAPAQPVKTGGK